MQKRRIPLMAGAVLLAAPATSHALAGAPTQSCYTHLVNRGQDPTTQTVTEPIVVNLTGGTPGGRFQVALARPKSQPGGSGFASGTFDAAGNGQAAILNVYPNPTRIGPLKGQKLNITATDYGAGIADQPIGSTRLTNYAYAVGDSRNPRKKRVVKVSGRPYIGKKVFGFVTNKSGKKVLKRFKVGKANACGYAKTKAVVAPSPFRYGKFRLYLNPGKKLKRKQSIATRFRIRRVRVF